MRFSFHKQWPQYVTGVPSNEAVTCSIIRHTALSGPGKPLLTLSVVSPPTAHPQRPHIKEKQKVQESPAITLRSLRLKSPCMSSSLCYLSGFSSLVDLVSFEKSSFFSYQIYHGDHIFFPDWNELSTNVLSCQYYIVLTSTPLVTTAKSKSSWGWPLSHLVTPPNLVTLLLFSLDLTWLHAENLLSAPEHSSVLWHRT